MLRLATDEDCNNRIVRGLLRRQPELDILRVQDAGLAGKDDEEVLAWAAREGRILITHDVTTMKQTAYEFPLNSFSPPNSSIDPLPPYDPHSSTPVLINIKPIDFDIRRDGSGQGGK
jgi:hypothetical protein